MYRILPEARDYLNTAMGKVSRSFALVVDHLEEPLKYFMATAYLACRVVDNIEDCHQPVPWQRQRFREFIHLLDDPASAADILSAWTAERWPGLTHHEQALMSVDDGLRLWEIYGKLPEPIRAVIGHWTAIMASGMAHLEEPDYPPTLIVHNGLRLLATEDDYNSYCYFVAGTVGHLGTELVVNHYGLDDEIAVRLRRSCEACGRGLQKINILKDFAEDLAHRICYLPAAWLREIDYAPLALAGAPLLWKQRVIRDILNELQEASSHVLSVPPTAAGYRMASLLCLLPALQTLQLAAQRRSTLFTARHQIKISRTAMFQCVRETKLLWQDNDAIARHCQSLARAVEDEMNVSPQLVAT